MTAVPVQLGLFDHQALRTPTMAYLLRNERVETVIMVVADAHLRGVRDREAHLFGDEPELSISDAMIVRVECELFKDLAPDRHISRIAFGRITRTQGPEPRAVPTLDQVSG